MASPVGAAHIRNLKDTVTNVTNGVSELTLIIVTNTSSALTFLQVFDAAAADVTLGTTRPVFSAPVANNTMETLYFGPLGWYIGTRFSAAATTTVEGSTGAADGVFLQVFVN